MFANLPQEYLNNLTFSVIALVVTYVLSLVIKVGIDFIFGNIKKRISHETLLAKTRTIRSLLKSVIDIVLFLTVILIVLSRWDINIVPILTGAGILGLAISFGAQTLVKDIISGIFIILEDQFSVGDMIKVDKYEGEVHRITLRLTVLKDKKGNVIYIPNSQITSLVRFTKSSSS